MDWQKIWLVIRREYLVNFKRPSFLFTAFGVPAFSLIAMFLIIQLTTSRETSLDKFQNVGYIDSQGIIDASVETEEEFQPITAPGAEAGDIAAQQAYANDLLNSGDLDAYFVITETYVLTGQIELYSTRNIPYALHENVESFMRTQIAARAPDSLPVTTDRLAAPAEMVIRDLDSDEELTEAQLIGRLMLPFIFVFIYFMATSTTAQFLMSGVVEEKENRLMEILATSLRPIELLWGKMLGLGALSLTQIVLWAAAGIALASFNDSAKDFIAGATFATGDLLLIGVLFIANFLLFAAIMMAIGAAVTAEAESRQFAGIVTFITVIPMALLVTFMTNPNGPLPLFFTFFPLTAAVGLILRLGLTDLPTWQILLSLAIQLVSTVAMMWLAAKVFRLGMLMYGKPLTPREFWRALREGRVTMTTAQTEGSL